MRPLKAYFAGVLLTLSASGALLAQSAQPAIDEFGIQDGIDLWIPYTEFVGPASWSHVVFGYGYTPVAQIAWATVALPQGAYLDSWRALYYDNSGANDVSAGLFKWYDDTTSSPSPGTLALGSFTSSGTPGYANHHQIENATIDLREPKPGSGVTRNEAADYYAFYVSMPADPNVWFKGVRVVWHRQVSPAPATATFNDVPTSDTAFQFIEALAASGITAGCGNGNYCPDSPLTRRQMAVFLAKALGLHWPAF